MAAFTLYSVVTTIANSARQALATFAVDDDKDTQRSLGYTECDTVGAALMGRAFHDAGDVVTAEDVAANALPAYTKRARLVLQNTSSAGDLVWFDFGSDAVAGACFQLFPGQLLVLEGAACPPDRLSVVADTGKSPPLYVKDW